MFPKPQACLAPSYSHLEALGLLFSHCPPSTPSTFHSRARSWNPAPIPILFLRPLNPQQDPRVSEFPESLEIFALLISETGVQGPERGRDLPEVTQQIRSWNEGAVPLLPAGGIPHFPISCRGWGRPQGPRGRAEVWAGRVPACLFH